MVKTVRLSIVVTMLLVLTNQATAIDDPTRPSDIPTAETSTVADPSALVVQAIVFGPERRIATINGLPLKVGGKINGYAVALITEREVSLKKGKDTKILRVYPRTK